MENLFYTQQLETSNIMLLFIKVFGTAIMLGSSTAIFAILSKNFNKKG